MKTGTFLLLITLFSANAFSQQTFFVSTGTEIKTTGGVNIVFNNTDVVNNSTVAQSKGDGTVQFEGDLNNTISGSGKTSFDNIIIAKATDLKVSLKRNIAATSNVIFKSGSFDAADNVLDLGNKGLLINESEGSRAYASGNGYIIASADINSATVANPGNLGAIISAPVGLGKTIIKRGNTSYYNGKDNSVSRFYDIVPEHNTALNAKTSFKYFDAELNGLKESDLSIYKNIGNNWVSEGNEVKDIKQNYISKQGINSFSKVTFFASPEDISVFPNPVADAANIKLSSLQRGTVILKLYDSKGSVVSTIQKSITQGVNQFNIDMNSFAAGNYKLQADWNNLTKVISIYKAK